MGCPVWRSDPYDFRCLDSNDAHYRETREKIRRISVAAIRLKWSGDALRRMMGTGVREPAGMRGLALQKSETGMMRWT
jgi:hypothetical protein